MITQSHTAEKEQNRCSNQGFLMWWLPTVLMVKFLCLKMTSNTLWSGPCLAFCSFCVPISLLWMCNAFHPGTFIVLCDWNVLLNLPFPNELDNYSSDLSALREFPLTPWNRSVAPKGVLIKTCVIPPQYLLQLQLHIYFSDELINVYVLST